MITLERGQKSPTFLKNKGNHPEQQSFSVYYSLPSNPEEKTLDVVCKDTLEFEIWVSGLEWLIQNKEAVTASANETEAVETTNRRGSLKLVNLESLRNEMSAHLDLCTWGHSAWGQLGHADKPEEIADIGSPRVILFFFSHTHSFAHTLSLSLTCCQKIRVLVDKDVQVKFVACGDCHTIAVAKTGECYGWGNAHSGRLGILPSGFRPEDGNANYSGIFDHVLIPQVIDRVRGVDTVACGSAHTLFGLNDGRLFVTGCNISGQVCDSNFFFAFLFSFSFLCE